jgi:hypothetical protein
MIWMGIPLLLTLFLDLLDMQHATDPPNIRILLSDRYTNTFYTL